LDPKKEYRIDLNNHDSIRYYLDQIDSNLKMGKLIAFEKGVEEFTGESVLANFLMKLFYQIN
jgi:hypothetical protein